MGRKKKIDTESTSASESTSNGTPAIKTKADAFRAAVAAGIESPKAISEYVKTTYGMEMSAGMVSAYKSLEKNKGKKRAPKKALATNSTGTRGGKTAAHSGGSSVGNGIMSQLEAIKSLVKELGGDQVKRMVDLFA
jgi:hypothetical protein